jgi:hypothetical protein
MSKKGSSQRRIKKIIRKWEFDLILNIHNEDEYYYLI